VQSAEVALEAGLEAVVVLEADLEGVVVLETVVSRRVVFSGGRGWRRRILFREMSNLGYNPFLDLLLITVEPRSFNSKTSLRLNI